MGGIPTGTARRADRVGLCRWCVPSWSGGTTETARLNERVRAAAEGRGAVVVLVGAAGAGKSRLAREVIDEPAGPVVRRCCSGGPFPVPRCRTARWPRRCWPRTGRARRRPAPELAGFTGHLARLLPHWAAHPAGGGAEASSILLHEGIVRLLSVSGRGRGAVLVLEDLHWADAETLDAVDYFADALAGEPVLCVCTCRPDGTAAAELSERLLRRDPGSVLPVPSLRDEDVDRMLAACLGGATVPRPLVAVRPRAQ